MSLHWDAGSGKIKLMHIPIERTQLEQVQAEALVLPVFEGRPEERFGAAGLTQAGEITGKLGFTLLHHPQGAAAARVLLAGAGKPDKFDAEAARKLAGMAARFLKAKSVKKVAFAFYPALAEAVVEGAVLGNFDPDRYRTGNDKKSLESIAVVAAGDSAGLEEAVERGRMIAEAQNFTRELANEPANRLTPLGWPTRARQMAAKFGLECEVLERTAWPSWAWAPAWAWRRAAPSRRR